MEESVEKKPKRLKKSVVIRPYSEATIRLECDRVGVHDMIPTGSLMRKLKYSAPYGVSDAFSEACSAMKIASCSSRRVRQRKGALTGLAADRPRFIVCPNLSKGLIDAKGHSAPKEKELDKFDLHYLGEKDR